MPVSKPKFGDIFYNPVTKSYVMYVGKPDIPEHQVSYFKGFVISGIKGGVANFRKNALKPV